MRILLDTNILVSGLIGKAGPSGELLRFWLNGSFELVTSVYQLDELRRVVRYERLRHRLKPEQVTELIANMGARAMILTDVPKLKLSPDPMDDPILSTAIAGEAEMIVSGDKAHMVSLGHVHGIPIVTARDALSHFDAM